VKASPAIIVDATTEGDALYPDYFSISGALVGIDRGSSPACSLRSAAASTSLAAMPGSEVALAILSSATAA
jgi:hypothetical protein